MATLFERLNEEEAIVRGELDALREKIAAAEERLVRLTITRETAQSLLPEPADEEPVAPPAEQPAAARPSTADAASAPTPASTPAPPTPPARTPSVGIELGEAVERMLVALASAGREMKVHDIAVAIGEDPTERRVETTRSRLKSLAKKGKVTEGHPGWFAIAPTLGVTGPATGEAATTR